MSLNILFNIQNKYKKYLFCPATLINTDTYILLFFVIYYSIMLYNYLYLHKQLFTVIHTSFRGALIRSFLDSIHFLSIYSLIHLCLDLFNNDNFYIQSFHFLILNLQIRNLYMFLMYSILLLYVLVYCIILLYGIIFI